MYISELVFFFFIGRQRGLSLKFVCNAKKIVKESGEVSHVFRINSFRINLAASQK